MDIDKLLQAMGQVSKASSSGVKAGESGVSQEAEWVGEDGVCPCTHVVYRRQRRL